MRNILIILPIFTLFSFSPSAAQRMYENVVSSDDYRLEIELEKFEYKTFEPIVVFCRYINLSDRIDTVKNALDPKIISFMEFNLNDSSGREYISRGALGIIDVISATRYILQPNDSALFLMRLEPRPVNSYWYSVESYGWFEKLLQPGEYEVYATLSNDWSKKYKPALKSNFRKFKVIEINKEDEIILTNYANNYESTPNSYKVGNTLVIGKRGNLFSPDLARKYSDSPFSEFYYSGTVTNTISNISNESELEVKQLLLDYISKYPYSISVIGVVLNYIYSIEDIALKESAMDELCNLYEGSFLSEYMKCTTVRKKILYNYPDPDNIIKDMRNPEE